MFGLADGTGFTADCDVMIILSHTAFGNTRRNAGAGIKLSANIRTFVYAAAIRQFVTIFTSFTG